MAGRNEEEIKKYTALFEKADNTDCRDGEVTVVELKRMIQQEFGQDLPDCEITEMFWGLDKNNDGKITLDEFLGEMMKKPRRKAFKDAFIQLDKDNSGSLTKDEIRELVKAQGGCDADVDRMFSESDLNNDGKITLDEFMNMV